MSQRMAVGMKQHTVAQGVWPAVYTPDDVMVVPARFLTHRLPAKGTKPLLSAENTEYLPPITQLVLHPLNPQRLPLQLVRHIIGVVSPG